MKPPFPKTTISLIGIILLCCAIAGCEKIRGFVAKSSKITGQIFVVQQNRTNVKMGAVEVFYVSREVVDEKLKWITDQQKNADFLRSYRAGLRANDLWLQDLIVTSINELVADFQVSAQEKQKDAWDRYRQIPNISQFETIDRLVEANYKLFEESTIGSSPKIRWILTCLFFDWIQEKHECKTITDADGNFRITVAESRPGYLLASASRSILSDHKETYFWIKEIAGNEVDPIIMHSNNCIDEQSITRLLSQLATQHSSNRLTEKDLNLVDANWTWPSKQIIDEILGQDKEISQLGIQISELKNEREALFLDGKN